MTKVIFVTGAGGVGKTTIAGAVAARAAEVGSSTLVVTVDPARRLAQALGLSVLANEPSPVPGLPALEAAMLDAAASWEALVRRHTDGDTAERLVANRFFRAIADRFPAGQAYAAAEETARLAESGQYEFIVVDTPPVGGAADFFEAPSRIRSLVAGRALRVLTGPAIPGRRVLYSLTARPVLRLADRLLGGPLLEDVAEFLIDLRTTYDGIRARAGDVEALFHAAHTVVATTTDPGPMAQARRLLSHGPGTAKTVLVNRTVPAEWAGLGDAGGDPYARNLARWGAEARRQRQVLASLADAAVSPWAIPLVTPAPTSIPELASLVPAPALDQILS